MAIVAGEFLFAIIKTDGKAHTCTYGKVAQNLGLYFKKISTAQREEIYDDRRDFGVFFIDVARTYAVLGDFAFRGAPR